MYVCFGDFAHCARYPSWRTVTIGEWDFQCKSSCHFVAIAHIFFFFSGSLGLALPVDKLSHLHEISLLCAFSISIQSCFVFFCLPWWWYLCDLNWNQLIMSDCQSHRLRFSFRAPKQVACYHAAAGDVINAFFLNCMYWWLYCSFIRNTCCCAAI